MFENLSESLVFDECPYVRMWLFPRVDRGAASPGSCSGKKRILTHKGLPPLSPYCHAIRYRHDVNQEVVMGDQLQGIAIHLVSIRAKSRYSKKCNSIDIVVGFV